MASGFLEVEEEGLAAGVWGWGSLALRFKRLSPSLTWVCLQATGLKGEVELGICWESGFEVEALGFFLSDRIGELEVDRGLLDPSESDFFEEEKKSLFLNTIFVLFASA